MIHVVLTSVVVLFAAIPYSPEVNTISAVSYVADPVVKTDVNVVESDNNISSEISKCNHHTNTDYQFHAGYLLLYLFYSLICLLLLFQVWIDYNLPRSKKDYE